MPDRFLALVLRNCLRSKTRLVAATLSCAIGAFIVCFFLSAEGSLERMLGAAKNQANIIVRQQDRY